MLTKNKYRVLIWLIAILLATNLSMVFSFIYHKKQEEIPITHKEEPGIEVPEQQRTKFFREQLNLEPYQMDTFRELNRIFNRTAWQINHQLNNLRIDMVKEMGRKNPREEELSAISKKIGTLHTELKNVTIAYYLDMKKICTEQQQQQLNTIFMSIIKDNEDVKLPGRGRRHRNNW